MDHIIINNHYGSQVYALSYILAFLTVIIVFVISGVRNKFPLQKLLLITAAGTLIFVVGNKLLAMQPQDWRNLLDGQPLTSHGGKTVLGGLAGLLIGSWVIARWLRIDFRVFDHLAVGLPLGMAVTRVGCLFAGCCYGKPSCLPWAISYPQHSHAFHAQFSEGMVRPHDLFSLPVHPTQVYDIIFCLLIALIVWRTSRYWKATGSRLLLAVLLYGGARFIIEFFRDPLSNSYAGQYWLGLKYIQWGLLFGVVILGSFLTCREKLAKRSVPHHMLPDESKTWRQVSLLILVVLTYCSLQNWLDLPERTTITLVIIPAVLSVTYSAIINMLTLRYRLITGMISVTCLILMSQTYIPTDKSTKIRFFEGGATGIFGHYRDFTGTAYQGTDCDGDTYYDFENVSYYKYKYQLSGINLSYNERIGPYERFNLRLSGYVGVEHCQNDYLYDQTKYSIYTFHPNMSYSWKNAGIDLGLHLGNFTYAHFNGPTSGLAKRVYKNQSDRMPNRKYSIMPSIGLRLGPQNIIYVDAQYANPYPMNSPLMKFSVGMSTGLGKFDGRKLGMGFCPGGLYLNCTVPVKERFVINALFMESFTSGSKNRVNFSFGLNYRFGYKEVQRKNYTAK